MKTILVIGSNSPTSINLDVAKKIKNKKPEYELLETNNIDVKIFRPDYLEQGFPSQIEQFMNKLIQADNIVFVTPEYNGYLTPHFKNIMDWCSVSKHGMRWLENKNIVIVSASPGSTGGSTVRELFSRILPYTGAKIIQTVGIPFYKPENNIDKEINNIIEVIDNIK